MMPFSDTIPLQKLENETTRLHQVNLYVLRLDTIDLYAGGNKIFKLKYNLKEAHKQGFKKILTFGGAWSNHLAAIALVNSKQLSVIAIVRGEEPSVYSDTLNYCKEKGVQLHFVSREAYRNKTSPAFIEELKNKFGAFYLLPEGGTNAMAVKGCKEIVNYIHIDFDYICSAVGSGGTIAGITSALKNQQQAIGFALLKGADYLIDEINKLIPPTTNLKLNHDYHFGGYAKTSPELISFKKNFETQFSIPLDYVYTVKMFYGIFDLIKKGYFTQNSTIIAIHTGGLQGNNGFEK